MIYNQVISTRRCFDMVTTIVDDQTMLYQRQNHIVCSLGRIESWIRSEQSSYHHQIIFRFSDKLSKYFHTSQQNMADKAATTPTTTPTTDGGSNNNVMTSPTTTTTSASSASSASSSSSSSSNKLNKRKLSFMNPFTSRQNSESSLQSPSNETTASTTTHNSGTDSPRHRKSISAHTEHHGSAASSTSETSSTMDGEEQLRSTNSPRMLHTSKKWNYGTLVFRRLWKRLETYIRKRNRHSNRWVAQF